MDTANDSTAVAVVGLAFDFPQCDDWDSLTEILRTGRDCMGPMPTARAEATGTTRSDDDQEGGWIEDITSFDHRYFGLSRAEAELIDPRQRKMLQLAVRAIGNAGYAHSELSGRDVCVYTAGYGGIEPTLHDLLPEADRLEGAAITGSIRAFAAGRIAYHLDLRGTALVVDTACSSFLVALHEARWKLARGEGEAALVGGYELILGRPRVARTAPTVWGCSPPPAAAARSTRSRTARPSVRAADSSWSNGSPTRCATGTPCTR